MSCASFCFLLLFKKYLIINQIGKTTKIKKGISAIAIVIKTRIDESAASKPLPKERLICAAKPLELAEKAAGVCSLTFTPPPR